MFVKAIERVSDFTRPIHSILRIYPSNNIIPGAATLFFVNENGYAITCKHVAESLLHAENINQQYIQFRNETKAGKNLQELEAKYKYGQDHIIQIKNNFVDVWRNLNPDRKDVYTYWDQKTRARDRNVGWRIDYFFVDKKILSKIKHAGT